MECDFAIALPYNLDFKTDELDHLPASRQFKYYRRLLQAVLEDAQELLEEASILLKLLLSTTMSWTTFQPRGSSSTIEGFSKQYSRTLKNYSKRLQYYSKYYSRLQRARGLVGHTPRVPQGRKQTDS
jgi:nicotinamide riboside kinase